MRYLLPTDPVVVYVVAPEPARPVGTPMVLVANDRTTVVAEFRLPGRRPYRVQHEGFSYECMEQRGEVFVYRRMS